MKKQRVLLTGASGSMGNAAFLELLKRRDNFEIVLLLRPSAKNQRAFNRYAHTKGLTVVWGDLNKYSDVEKAVKDVDVVLHAGAMIPPAADRMPRQAFATNVLGTHNLLTAMKNQGALDHVRFAYVSSIAVYGDRLPPMHHIRVGDPVMPSIGDMYGLTKAVTERLVIESGIKHWAILRQTYIAIPKAWTLMDAIMFHQPLNTRLELITARDAGFGLAQTADVPDAFFGRIYNMSGGPSCRVVYEDYLNRSMALFGLGAYRDFMEPSWFATRNFHCGYYDDNEDLNNTLHHQRDSLDDHFSQMKKAIPTVMRLGSMLAPSSIVKAFLKRMADPYHWVKRGETEKVEAFLKSEAAWQAIPDWAKLDVSTEDKAPSFSHKEMSLSELATSRGGELLDESEDGKYNWRCAMGHEFSGSEALVRAGHWCPKCLAPPWSSDVMLSDPAIARLYQNTHDDKDHFLVHHLFAPFDFNKALETLPYLSGNIK